MNINKAPINPRPNITPPLQKQQANTVTIKFNTEQELDLFMRWWNSVGEQYFHEDIRMTEGLHTDSITEENTISISMD